MIVLMVKNIAAVFFEKIFSQVRFSQATASIMLI